MKIHLLSYTDKSIPFLEKELSTSSTQGLSFSQIATLQSSVPKLLVVKRYIWPRLLLRQFTSIFIIMLIVSSIALFFLESKLNAILILSIVMVNGLLTFFQEYRASQALELLKQHLQLFCPTLREGKLELVPYEKLLVGDLVVLEQGNYVPADIRIVSGKIRIDESLLTGESAEQEKTGASLASEAQDIYGANNMAFFGTTISQGTAKGIVVATGSGTLFGEVSRETLQNFQQSGFQERLATLSRFLVIVIGITFPLILLSQLIIKGWHIDLLEVSIFAIALVIGLTPEMLPTVTTFALSKGAVLLAKHNVIVKRLSAIEDLGSITMLLTDKTGTLTKNSLALVSVYEEGTMPVRQLARMIACHETTDAFDKATREALAAEDTSEYTVLDEQPFDPVKRTSAILVQWGGEPLLIVRGTVEEICPQELTPEAQEWVSQHNAEGNRVLAYGYAEQAQSIEQRPVKVAGFLAFTDPIKETAASALLKARKLGIEVRMVTGDSKEVGCYVAKKIGLSSTLECAISGAEFELLSPEQKREAVRKYVVFARFLPTQKYELVELCRKHYTVGFLGDGINDAPALKAAHVGIVVQSASDLAKDSSDIIMLHKSLFDVVYGIGIGRNIFVNTIKYLITSIASNFGNFYSLAIASLFIDFLPLLPRQILLVNMLSDLPMVAIATDTVDFEELNHPPRFVMKDIAVSAAIFGMISSLFDFLFFACFKGSGPMRLQTAWFTESISTEIVLIYSLRTRLPFYKARRPSLTLMLLSAFVLCCTCVLPMIPWVVSMFHLIPLSLRDMATIAGIVLGYFLLNDRVKVAYYKNLMKARAAVGSSSL
jgi:Mg2+-importing ATPase